MKLAEALSMLHIEFEIMRVQHLLRLIHTVPDQLVVFPFAGGGE